MVFDDLTEQLGMEKFKELFPVILTDNGSEFKIQAIKIALVSVDDKGIAAVTGKKTGTTYLTANGITTRAKIIVKANGITKTFTIIVK